jgi:hypothetical protein
LEITILIHISAIVGRKKYRNSEKNYYLAHLSLCTNVFIYSFTPISIKSLMQTLDPTEATRGVILHHTHLKNQISAYRVCRTVLKVKRKKNVHVGMPFFHVRIYHMEQWAKKYSVVSCVVCFFQNRENIFCCDATKISILKAVDQTRQNYILTIYDPVAILCINYCEYISKAQHQILP